jgi:hypothetical protein
MSKNKYNYSLNGIEHEITLNNNLKIDQKPINEKILVSNKYIIKYVNDLFDYHSIEYCMISQSLLGIYIFNGINIFNPILEICTADNNFFKIKKIEDEIKNDGFEIKFNEKNIKISTIFFDKIKTFIYIYPLNKNPENDLLSYITYDQQILSHNFYDIYPIKKSKYEEFEISVPNKIDKILESYNLNLNYIVFSKDKTKDKKIIEEIENKNVFNTIITDNINKFISIIKPFFNE